MPIALLFDLRTVLDLAEQAITATNPADGVAASPALCWVTGDGTYLTADPGHRRRVYATGYGPGTPWLDARLAGIDTPGEEAMPLHTPARRQRHGVPGARPRWPTVAVPPRHRPWTKVGNGCYEPRDAVVAARVDQ